jgi:hypothetical protein
MILIKIFWIKWMIKHTHIYIYQQWQQLKDGESKWLMVCHLLLVCHYLKIVEPRKIHSPSFFLLRGELTATAATSQQAIPPCKNIWCLIF